MIEHLLTNIISYAALSLFIIGLYETYKYRNKSSQILEANFRAKKQREEVEAEIKKLDGVVIEKQKAYEAAKERVYEIINKRSSSGTNSDGSDSSKRSE